MSSPLHVLADQMVALARSLGFAIAYDPIDHLTRIHRDLDS